MASDTPYCEMRALECWLGPRQVFRDLTLSLYPGEHTVVLGPNGSGKSSLIKLLSRELYPVVKEGSSLRIFGEDTINLWRLRARMGLLSQQSHTAARREVRGRDVVLSGFFGSAGLGRSQQPTDSQRRRVERLLHEVGLADLAERPFSQLSEGQKRRFLLARALVHDPEVLVLDEPTNGLDLLARHQLLQELGRLARAGTTLLLVSHRIEEIIPEIQRAVLLKDGTVVGDGTTADLLRDGPLSALYGLPLQVVSSNGWRQVLPVLAQKNASGLHT
ncbi:MAG: ATP-binding cassette domain-containing protein [Cyanobacteriota bacterium]|nr:ATP-binding cassette domain-containing protein [Cyanobacteriota bacterium]